jgi:transcriptional regulator with XRE-family HTH domain
MIGQRIRQLRKEKFWTQRELGARAEIEPKNIGGYESGRLTPSKKTLEKFAQALGVTLDELLASARSADSEAIEDKELVELVKEMQRLPDAERAHLKWVISVAVRQHRIQAAMVS